MNIFVLNRVHCSINKIHDPVPAPIIQDQIIILGDIIVNNESDDPNLPEEENDRDSEDEPSNLDHRYEIRQ